MQKIWLLDHVILQVIHYLNRLDDETTPGWNLSRLTGIDNYHSPLFCIEYQGS